MKGQTNTSILQQEYPKNSSLIGSDEEYSDFKIFIYRKAIDEIDTYLSSDINKELGGVLIGNVCCNNEGTRFLIIEDFIIAKYTTASVSRLTFTHDTWNYMYEILEKNFPTQKIVGWFHSHPGHSVFLSAYDVFIQENFFNLDFMAAYVYDPTIKDRGFFHWKENQIIKAKGFWIFEDKNIGDKDFEEKDKRFFEKENNIFYENKIIENKIDTKNMEENIDKKNNNGNLINILLFIFLSINLILLIFLLIRFEEFKNKTITRDEFNSKMLDINFEINELKQSVNNKSIVEDSLNNASPIHKNTNSIQYVVKEGDDLKKIASIFYKDENKFDLIMKFNNLNTESEIKEGQIIELPILSE